MTLKITQVDYKTQQLYNKRIAKLLGLGYKVYVTAFMPNGGFNIKYKVSLNFSDALLWVRKGYVLGIFEFKPGNAALWSRDVELPTERKLKADKFIQVLYQGCSELSACKHPESTN